MNISFSIMKDVCQNLGSNSYRTMISATAPKLFPWRLQLQLVGLKWAILVMALLSIIDCGKYWFVQILLPSPCYNTAIAAIWQHFVLNSVSRSNSDQLIPLRYSDISIATLGSGSEHWDLWPCKRSPCLILKLTIWNVCFHHVEICVINIIYWLR
jgi:hypothetical protein